MDGHVEQQHMVHLLAEAAEMRRQEEVGVDAGRPADDAAVDEPSDAAHRRDVAAVLDDGVNAPGIAGGGNHGARFGEARGERLLAQQMTAVAEGGSGNRGPRRRHHDVEDDVGFQRVEHGVQRIADGGA